MENNDKDEAVIQLREKVAAMLTRIEALESKTDEILEAQVEARNRSEQAALRERDLGNEISKLNENLKAHLQLHNDTKQNKMRVVDVVLVVGMLLVSGISAYGAVAMVALTKAMAP